MFIKQTKSSGHIYIQIVQSYRDEKGATRHKLLLTLGRLDKLREDASFKSMMAKITELIEQEGPFSIEGLKGQKVLNWGYAVYEKLWKKYGMERFFLKLQQALNLQYDVGQTVFFEVLNHLLEPCSKKAGYEKRVRYAGLETPEDLNVFYRCLDVLADHKEEIEEYLFERNRTLFNMHVDVVLYDVTTFHFESVEEDALKRFGYSKAGKANEVQVVLGMLVDMEGRPVGYELFPGNTNDAKTLETVLEGLKNRFKLNKVIVVADRGINSKMNLKTVKEQGYGYVMASRLKSMPSEIREYAKERETGWTETENGWSYKMVAYTNAVKDPLTKETHSLEERMVITYSPEREKKDRADRQRLVEKARKLLVQPSAIEAQFKRGGKKYLKQIQEEKTEWLLNEAAIEEDAQWDGLYAIQTSEKELDARKIVAIYHDLWRIEESFRVMKSQLEVRPVFHWTPRRIKGHFVLCFLAFLLERTLEWMAREKEIEATPEKIRGALNELEVCELEYNGKTFYLKMQGNALGQQLVRMMHLSPPANVTAKENWKV